MPKNQILWYFGVALKESKRIFDFDKFFRCETGQSQRESNISQLELDEFLGVHKSFPF